MFQKESLGLKKKNLNESEKRRPSPKPRARPVSKTRAETPKESSGVKRTGSSGSFRNNAYRRKEDTVLPAVDK